MDLTPIVLPDGWTAEQDFDAFVDCYGESEDYYKDALDEIAKSYEDLNEVVDEAITYFQRKDHRLVRMPQGILNLDEKLHWLGSITQCCNDDYEYKRRFAWHIHGCRWADKERERVLQTYLAGGEQVWLRLLCAVADALGCAANELRDAMKCEHRDYENESENDHG